MAENKYDSLLGDTKILDTGNKYDSVLADQQNETSSNLKASMQTAIKKNPDQQANVIDLAEKSGLPVDTVGRNENEIQQKVNFESTDYDALLKSNPVLSENLSDNEFASVAHDDVDNLSFWENNKSFAPGVAGIAGVEFNSGGIGTGSDQAIGDILRSIPGGFLDAIGMGLRGIADANSAFGRSVARSVGINDTTIDVGIKQGDFLDNPIVRQILNPGDILRDPGNMISSLAEDVKPPAERQNLATDISAGVGQITAQIGVSIINPGVGLGFLFGQGADQQSQRAIDEGATPEERDQAILIGSAITGITEKVGLDALLNRIPPKIKNNIVRQLTDIGIAGGIEAAQEAVEGILQNLTAIGIYDSEGNLIDGIDREATAAGGAGAIFRAIINAITPGRMSGTESRRGQSQQGVTNKDFLDKVGDTSKESKLRERSPEKYKKLVAESLEKSGIENVGIPADKLQVFFQENPDSFADFAGNIEGFNESFAKAQALGEDVLIPTDVLATYIAPQEYYSELSNDIRVGSEAMTANESEEFSADAAAQLQSDFEQFADQIVTNQEGQVSGDLVFEDVKAQLIAAGQPEDIADKNALLHKSFFETMAERTGIDAFSLFQGQNLKIRSDQQVDRFDSVINALRDGTGPTEAQALGPTLTEHLRDIGGIRDDSGELTSRDLDKNLPAFTRNLIQPETGIELDAAVQSAVDAGFINQPDPNAPTDFGINELLDLIDAEQSGQSVFSTQFADAEISNLRDEINNLDEVLGQNGIDIQTATNQEIKDFFDGIVGQEFDQIPAYKDASFIYDQARNKFLDTLPEDAETDDVNQAIEDGEFSAEYANFLNALERDDWLGFDFPSQAVDAALSEEQENFELSQGLKSAIGRLVNADSNVFNQEDQVNQAKTFIDRLSDEGNLPEIFKRQSGDDVVDFESATPESLGLAVSENALGKVYTRGSGRIAVMENAEFAPRENSITDFVVEDGERGSGIGSDLLSDVLKVYDKTTISAAASSESSVAVFYKNGFRPIRKQNATLDESIELMNEDSSVTMVTPTNNSLPEFLKPQAGELPDPDFVSQAPAADPDAFSLDQTDQPRRAAQRNEIGLYSAVEQAVIDMPLPAWKKKVKFTQEEKNTIETLNRDFKNGLPKDLPEREEFEELLNRVPRANGKDIWNKLKSMPGIKKEEIEWLGIEDYLNSKDKFTREEVTSFVQSNGVVVTETIGDQESNDSGVEFDWQESVWDDPEAWEVRASDIADDITNGSYDSEYGFSANEWLINNIDQVISNYEPTLDADSLLAVEEAVNDGSEAQEIIDIIEAGGYDVTEDMLSQMEDDIQEAAEDFAREEYFSEPYNIWFDSETDIYIFGNDGVGYQVTTGNIGGLGADTGITDVYSFGEAEIQAEQYAIEEGLSEGGDSDENVARWEDYVMDGFQDNYREVKLILPNINPTFNNDVHFPDDNLVTFLRVDDREFNIGKTDLPETPSESAIAETSLLNGRDITFGELNKSVDKLQKEYIDSTLDRIPEKAKEFLVKIENDGLHKFASPAADLRTNYPVDAEVMYDMLRTVSTLFNNGDLTDEQRKQADEFISKIDDTKNKKKAWNKESEVLSNAERVYNSRRDSEINRNTYFIDEFQSDWHQDGRQRGYAVGLNTVELSGQLIEAQTQLEIEINKIVDTLLPVAQGEQSQQLFDSTLKDGEGLDGASLLGLQSRSDRLFNIKTDTAFKNVKKLIGTGFEYDGLSEQINNIEGQSKVVDSLKNKIDSENKGVPNAPFKGDGWISLGLKRAIVDAVENDYEAIAWADAEVLVDRWSEQYRTLYETQYDKKMPTLAKKITKIKPEHVSVEGEGEVVGYWIIEITPELKERVQSEGLSLFQDAAKKRGRIIFTNDGTIIDLFKDANLSTFLHESGHLFLNAFSSVAGQIDAPVQIKQDMDAILKWLDIDSIDMLDPANNGDAAVAAQEKWARGMETYLREGKAPSTSLQAAFQRFKAWLVNVYRNVRSLNVEITDEIRAVMDRMLATDDEIASAQDRNNIRSVFEADGTLDANQAAQVNQVNAEAIETAKEKLLVKLLREITREKKKWWKSEKAATKKEVEAEYNQRQDFKTKSWLQTGKLPDGSELGIDPVKLSRADLVAMYGDGKDALWRKLPFGKNAVWTSQGGVHPDVVAGMFGYRSGDQMVRDVVDAGNMKIKVDEETQRRMLAKNGDILNDGTIEAEADDAMHNINSADAMLSDINQLNKKTNRGTSPKQVFRNIAKQIISEKKASEIKPASILQNERRVTDRLLKAIESGDDEAALKLANQRLINHFMYMEARDAVVKISAIQKRMSAIKTRKYNPKQIDPSYINQLRLLANMYDFRKGNQKEFKRAQENVLRLVDWIKAQQENGDAVYIPELISPDFARVASMIEQAVHEGKHVSSVIPNIKVKPYGEMTLGELVDVDNTAKHLRFIGAKNSEQAREELAAHAQDLADSIINNGGDDVEVITDKSWFDKAKEISLRFSLDQIKLLSDIRLFDGFEDFGPMFNSVYQHVVDGTNKRITIDLDASERIAEIYKPLKKELNPKNDIKTFQKDDSPGSWSLSSRERIMLAMYWGSPESREAIMVGHNVVESDVQKMLDTLSEKELDFVENIWEFNESFWGELSTIEAKINGVPPVKVEHIPFEASGRQLAGGYFRLYYEWSVKDKFKIDMHDEAGKVMHSNRVTQSKTGAVISRVGSGGRMVKLDPDSFFRAIEDNLQFIAFAESSREVARISQHPVVAQAIVQKYGKDRYQSFIDSLDGVFAGDVANNNPVNKMLRGVRTNLTFGYLALSVRNFIQQPIALTQAMGRIGEKEVLKAVMDVYMHPKQNWDFIKGKSVFMEQRNKFVNREAAEQLASIKGSSGLGWKPKWAFVFQTTGDALATYPAWLAAYRQGIEKFSKPGRSESEMDKMAVTYADEMVASTVGSGLAKDLAPLFQGSGSVAREVGSETVKQLTFMGSFFNMTYNLYYDAWTRLDTGSVKSELNFAREMAWYALVPGMLSAWAVGDGPDDDEEIWEWAIKATAEFGFSSSMFWRNMVSTLKGFEPSIPAFQFFKGVGRAGKIGVDLATDEKDFDGAVAAALIRSFEPLISMPGGGQAARTLEYLDSYEQGDEGEFSLHGMLIEGKDR